MYIFLNRETKVLNFDHNSDYYLTMILANLDIDALRTLAITQDLGGFGRAAEQLRRTPSAISLQMKRLQDEVGVPLFRRQGRKTLLTDQGEIALRYARRVLDLNDEMLDTLRGASLSGAVRIGFSQDFVETVLPPVLSRFHALYPLVQLEVKVDLNVMLESDVDAGKLDLALTLGNSQKRTNTMLGAWPLRWIAGPGFKDRPEEPLPLVLFEAPCIFRSRALDALDNVGRSWRIAMTSPSLTGLWAAVSTGLGLTVRAENDGVPETVRLARTDLPPLGEIGITLHRRKGAKPPYMLRLTEITEELVRSQLRKEAH